MVLIVRGRMLLCVYVMGGRARKVDIKTKFFNQCEFAVWMIYQGRGTRYLDSPYLLAEVPAVRRVVGRTLLFYSRRVGEERE